MVCRVVSRSPTLDLRSEATYIVFDSVTLLKAATGSPSTRITDEDVTPDPAADRPACDAACIVAAAASAPATSGMVGDVNLFLLGAGEAAQAQEAWATLGPPSAEAAAAAAGPKAAAAAEVMVMIAAAGARGRGMGAEAVSLMLQWATSTLGVEYFVAKISESNAASLALFGGPRGLGFVEAARIPAFGEVHLVRGPGARPARPTPLPLVMPLPPES